MAEPNYISSLTSGSWPWAPTTRGPEHGGERHQTGQVRGQARELDFPELEQLPLTLASRRPGWGLMRERPCGEQSRGLGKLLRRGRSPAAGPTRAAEPAVLSQQGGLPNVSCSQTRGHTVLPPEAGIHVSFPAEPASQQQLQEWACPVAVRVRGKPLVNRCPLHSPEVAQPCSPSLGFCLSHEGGATRLAGE